jgi:hypothetical protein
MIWPPHAHRQPSNPPPNKRPHLRPAQPPSRCVPLTVSARAPPRRGPPRLRLRPRQRRAQETDRECTHLGEAPALAGPAGYEENLRVSRGARRAPVPDRYAPAYARARRPGPRAAGAGGRRCSCVRACAHAPAAAHGVASAGPLFSAAMPCHAAAVMPCCVVAACTSGSLAAVCGPRLAHSRPG